MKFDQLKTVIRKLGAKKYVRGKIEKDHIVIHWDCGEDDFEKYVKEELITKILQNNENWYGFVYTTKAVFINNEKFKDALDQQTYGEIERDIREANLSYIERVTSYQEGLNAYIHINIGKCESDVRRMIREINGVEVVRDGLHYIDIRTQKAKEWAKKKSCCKTIKFHEDLTNILNEIE